MLSRTLSFGLLLTCLSALRAQDVVLVTNLNDAGAGSFRTAVANAFPGDTVRFTVTGTIAITTGTVTYNKDLVIDGPGEELLTLDGGDALIPLEATGGSTWMSGLTIANGRDPYASQTAGGGMGFSGDTLVMRHVRITGCKKTGIGGSQRMGGGLRAQALKARIIDCAFDNNYIQPLADDNGFAYGGGIYLVCPDYLLQGTTIAYNTARGRENQFTAQASGGGLYASGSGRIVDSHIDGNTCIGIGYYGGGPDVSAYVQGGGAYLTNGTVTFEGGSVNNNSCGSSADGYRYHYGGGIFAYMVGLELRDLELHHNQLPSTLPYYWPCVGGGVYAERGSVRTLRCVFDANEAVNGGAIYVDNEGTSYPENLLHMRRSRMTNNTSATGTGAVECSHVDDLLVQDSELSGNTYAGLWSYYSGSVHVDRSLFADNHGGGAYIESSSFGASLVNCTFQHNAAPIGGGLRGYNEPNLNVRNCTFMNDTITGGSADGREISLYSTLLTLTNTIMGASVFQPINAIGIISSTAISGGGNICRDNSGASFMTQPNDLNTANPQMGDFGDHGGFTRTWSLAANSTSIDQCGPDTLSVDQRGFLRDGNSDAGAFEYGADDPQQITNVSTGPDQVVCVNNPLSVSVQATAGAPIHYQWYLGGDPIEGATSATYTTTATVNDGGLYTCVLTTEGDTVTSDPISITIDLCTGIAANASTGLRCYPNPASAAVMIEAGAEQVGRILTVRDATGRMVRSQRLSSGVNVIDVRELSPGVYTGEVPTAYARYAARFVKQ